MEAFIAGFNTWSWLIVVVCAVIAIFLKYSKSGTGFWAIYGAALIGISIGTYSIASNIKLSVFDYPSLLLTSVLFLTTGARFVGEWLTADAKESDKKAREQKEANKRRQEAKEEKREQRRLDQFVAEAEQEKASKTERPLDESDKEDNLPTMTGVLKQ